LEGVFGDGRETAVCGSPASWRANGRTLQGVRHFAQDRVQDLRPYQECGLEGLTDRSRYANQLPFQVENYILNVVRPSASRKFTTTSGSSALWIMIWDTSIWRTKCSNRSKIPSNQNCHPCDRYVLLPMSPGQTLFKWLRGLDLNQRPLGYEGNHKLISKDLVRRG
jgi:hypothetical protein